jgi:hypothetical protein
LVVSAWVRGFLVDAVVLGWAGRMVLLTWKSDLGSHLEWVTASDVERRQRPILTLERGLHERTRLCDWSRIAPMTDLPQVLDGVAQSLQQAPSPHETLEAITHSAVGVVEGAELSAVSMAHGRNKIETVAATSDLAQAIDRSQYDTHQGPCLDTLLDEALVRMTDDEAEQRWPDFTERIRGIGICSMLGVRLFLEDNDVASLNLYSGTPDGAGSARVSRPPP